MITFALIISTAVNAVAYFILLKHLKLVQLAADSSAKEASEAARHSLAARNHSYQCVRMLEPAIVQLPKTRSRRTKSPDAGVL